MTGRFFLHVQFGENHTFDIVPQAQNIKRYNLYATKWKKDMPERHLLWDTHTHKVLWAHYW